MIQAMKFWETISAFRDDPEALTKVFGSDQWRADYYELYSHFDELVEEQRRDVLGVLLPLELTQEIAAHYQKRKFWFDPRQQELRAAGEGLPIPGEYIEMTALEVHDRFGGSVIEEVREYGSAYLNDNPLQHNEFP